MCMNFMHFTLCVILYPVHNAPVLNLNKFPYYSMPKLFVVFVM